MNWTVSPCADFYNFSCGNWLSSTSIPSDKSSYTRSFGMIEEHNDAILYDIVQDPSTGKVNTYWSACMNTTQIDAYGTTGLNGILAVVVVVKDLNTLMYAVGTLQRYGVNTFFGWGVEIDSENPSINIAAIGQGVRVPHCLTASLARSLTHSLSRNRASTCLTQACTPTQRCCRLTPATSRPCSSSRVRASPMLRNMRSRWCRSSRRLPPSRCRVTNCSIRS